MFMHSCGSIGVLYCVVFTQNSNGFKTLFENGFGKPLLKIKRAKEIFLSLLSSFRPAGPVGRVPFLYAVGLPHPAACLRFSLQSRRPARPLTWAGQPRLRRRAPPLSLALARWLHGPAPCNTATLGPLVSNAPFFYLKSASSRTLPRETRCPTPESPLIRLVSHA